MLQNTKVWGGEVIIMGDTNARVGEENDFVENNYLNAPDDYLPTPYDFEVDINVKKRKTLDNKELSGHHKQLLDFCKATGFKILNGRIGDDGKIGNFTCHTAAGSSIVDYCLTREHNFELMDNYNL